MGVVRLRHPRETVGSRKKARGHLTEAVVAASPVVDVTPRVSASGFARRVLTRRAHSPGVLTRRALFPRSRDVRSYAPRPIAAGLQASCPFAVRSQAPLPLTLYQRTRPFAMRPYRTHFSPSALTCRALLPRITSGDPPARNPGCDTDRPGP